MPKDPKYESPEEKPHKQQTRRTQPEETEEDRARKKKAAEDARARKKAAAEAQKIKADVAAEKAAENNRLQERIIVIRALRREIKLADVFDAFVELAPGPIFRARLWPSNVAEIEFCTDTAAHWLWPRSVSCLSMASVSPTLNSADQRTSYQSSGTSHVLWDYMRHLPWTSL